jgi:TolA-binding protein
MTYEEIVAKLKKGEALTAEDMVEFGKVTRPADRFNEISQKKQDAEAKLAEKDAEIARLQAEQTTQAQKIQDEAAAQMRELSGRVETLSGENTSLKQKQSNAEQLEKIRLIASTNVTGAAFKNPRYLKAIFEERGVDISKKEDVDKVLTELKEREPETFTVSVKGGSGTGTTPLSGGGSASAEKSVMKWSDEEKTQFIAKNGGEAYQKLVSTASQSIT